MAFMLTGDLDFMGKRSSKAERSGLLLPAAAPMKLLLAPKLLAAAVWVAGCPPNMEGPELIPDQLAPELIPEVHVWSLTQFFFQFAFCNKIIDLL